MEHGHVGEKWSLSWVLASGQQCLLHGAEFWVLGSWAQVRRKDTQVLDSYAQERGTAMWGPLVQGQSRTEPGLAAPKGK